MLLKVLTISFIFIIILTSPFFSDNGFSEYLVDGTFSSPSGLNTYDINEDGCPDILGSSWNGGLITIWYHQGDTPVSWNRVDIDSGFTGASFVNSADLNGDSVPEILGTAWYAYEVAYWIKQNDSLWIKYCIDSSFIQAHEVQAEDIDNDGDIDVLGASAGLNQITLWLNQGGEPLVWNEQVICSTMTGARSVWPVDLDLDGDLDVVGAAAGNHDIRWWENDGQNPPGFTEHLVESNFYGAHMVRAGDVNSDSYPDIAAVGWQINQVAVWINDGNNQSSWTQVVVDQYFNSALGVGLANLNSDNYLDIFATSEGSGDLAWYENDGLDPPGWNKQTIDYSLPGAWPLACADIDADGYIDIISGANYSTYINWYKNTTYTGISEFIEPVLISTPLNCFIHPNPFSATTTINLSLPESGNIEISIYNIYGAKINQLANQFLTSGSYRFTWNGFNQFFKPVVPGIYFIQVKFKNTCLINQGILFIP
ncbi:MAG: hypothetical protein APR63_08620 [Desulfuromonas sp. SDB]|nr:MAG: hypothetical protein APR63_08620 [Desulfuromonas sp. SDB]